jgi:uncharacterized protein (DUF2062 family)
MSRVGLVQRARSAVVHGILGVADDPGRIAWGVFLGTVVAWTPTLGLQIVIYVMVATLLRANKLSGIPILFITNPFTAVPLYWLCWRVGAWILGTHGGDESALAAQLESAEAEVGQQSLWSAIWTSEFWSALGETLLGLGKELWLGSAVLGVAMGLPLGLLTLWAVKAYRRARGAR